MKMTKLSKIWNSISAGVFLIGYNIGTGSITTMASAGSDYGMSLTWTLLLSCIFTFVMLMAFSRYTLQTGQGAMYSFKIHFGKPVTIFILFSLLFAEAISAMGLMGVCTEVIQEWTRPITADNEGFSPIITASVVILLLAILCWRGDQKFFEKILAVFVSLMGIAFILTMFEIIPSPKLILDGLKPSIPPGDNSLVVLAGMTGTTMGAIVYVVRSIMVKDKAWTLENMKAQRRDAVVSVVMMFVLSFAIMACAAGAMRGEHIENAIQMVGLIEPLAGRLATSIFVVGIVAAALSSLFPILLLAPWLISDYMGEPTNVRSKRSRILIYGVLACTIVVPIFGMRPVKVVLLSQALTMVATPFVVLFMTILLNKKDVMGGNSPSLFLNIVYIIIFLFTLYTTCLGMKGLFNFI